MLAVAVGGVLMCVYWLQRPNPVRRQHDPFLMARLPTDRVKCDWWVGGLTHVHADSPAACGVAPLGSDEMTPEWSSPDTI